MSQVAFSLKSHNPDVLTCIANLSNDEVFTAPELANQMLDSLEDAWSKGNDGANLWENKDVTFLDPCTKSGVFLREIVKRLINGLSLEFPDLTERVNHILSNQVFGMAITEITSLIARRSVYCSKYANGSHSVAKDFKNEAGNIWFERLEHDWVSNKCKYCGAGENEYKRGEDLDSHAYGLIHSEDVNLLIQSIFGDKVHFDVIIGNPPYHLNDGGFGASAKSIYQFFVEQAKKLEPRYLSMVIPARWFAGGKGLDDFRNSMINDERIRVIDDFIDSSDIFPGTQIKGGVTYFLWDRDNPGLAKITTHKQGKVISVSHRKLMEPGLDVFIRYEIGLEILKKIAKFENNTKLKNLEFTIPENCKFSNLVSPRKPFGLSTDFRGNKVKKHHDLKCYQIGGFGYVSESKIESGKDLINKHKIFVAYAGSGDQYPNPVISKPFIGQKKEICTETYLAIGPFESKQEAYNACSYMSTKFFRFLLLLRKPSQHVTRNVYNFIPLQDFSKSWTDQELYKQYNLTKDEIDFIESMVKPMEISD